MLGNIISILPLAILLTVMLVCGLIGLLRGLKKSLGSLVVIVLSAVFSLITTLILCNPELGIMDALFSKITGPLFDTMNLGALTEIEAFSVVSKYYMAMFVSPFVFTLLFFVFRLIFTIVMKIVIKKIPILQKLPKVANKLGGMGVGIVVGFLLVLVIMMPFLGTVNVVNVAITEMTEMTAPESENEDVEPLALASGNTFAEAEKAPSATDMLDSMVNKGAGKVLRVMGGDMLYKATSNKKYDGEKVSLETEISGMTGLLSGVTAMAADFSEYGDNQTDALGKIADSADSSPLIALISSECLSTAATKWSNGEEFMGQSSLGGGEPLIQPLMDAILEVFKTTNKDEIANDLRSVQGAFAVLGKYEVFEAAGDKDAMLDKLNKSPVLSEMAESLHDNARMADVEKEVSSLGVRAFASAVGVPENDPEYDKLMVSIAGSVNDSKELPREERRDMIKEELEKSAADYGSDVSGEVSTQIADRFIDELGDKENVTDQDIKDFIARYQSDTQA